MFFFFFFCRILVPLFLFQECFPPSTPIVCPPLVWGELAVAPSLSSHRGTPSRPCCPPHYISGVGSNKKVGGIQTGKMSGWGQRPLHMAIRWVWGRVPPEISFYFLVLRDAIRGILGTTAKSLLMSKSFGSNVHVPISKFKCFPPGYC